ncbi:MAG: type IV secretory system conjugative DNA transfer family protein [Spirochaetaceae bacterium]|jgi:type IV secretion system protein VirD4|nr:type IV secretory system conjugative DNA transfer family protein [Spirochaetaceae bacterium]
MSDNEFLRGKPADVSGEQRLSFIFKIITLIIITVGLQAAVQVFARSVNYDEGWAGKPWTILKLFKREVPVYSLLKMFYFPLAYWRRVEIHPFLWAAWKVSIYTSFAAIGFYFLLEFVLIRSRKQNIFGTARWANRKDLRKAGLLGTSGGMILGQLPDARLSVKYDAVKQSMIMHLRKPSRKIIQSGIYNTLLSAPTRSGKGVSNVIPTLLSYPGSMIVLDFKGENFNLTSGFRARFGKVYRWEPTGEKGHHFNPMEEIRGGDDAFSDANLIADILTTPASGGESSTGEHFRTGARDLLTAVILHCLTSPDWADKSLPGCRTFLNQPAPEGQEDNPKWIYDEMIHAEHGSAQVHQSVVEGAVAQRSRPDDEGGSMKSTVNNALAVFADAKIKRNTSDSEFYIDEFAETEVPITLYLTVQYSDVDRISALIRTFILLFSRRFTSGETQATNRKFKIPLLFVLDEFDKLGRMDELERNMGIHNGFGIHYFLIFQSLNQLTKIYTKDHAFLAHCRNNIFFAPGGEYECAESISKICGRESFSKANISYSGSRGALGYNSNSLSNQDQERNLINADEVMKLPLDSAILLCQGLPPAIIKKNVYYEDAVFTSRMKKEPAFSTREEAAKMSAATVKKIAARRWFVYKSALDEEIDNMKSDIPDESAVEDARAKLADAGVDFDDDAPPEPPENAPEAAPAEAAQETPADEAAPETPSEPETPAEAPAEPDEPETPAGENKLESEHEENYL